MGGGQKLDVIACKSRVRGRHGSSRRLTESPGAAAQMKGSEGRFENRPEFPWAQKSKHEPARTGCEEMARGPWGPRLSMRAKVPEHSEARLCPQNDGDMSAGTEISSQVSHWLNLRQF